MNKTIRIGSRKSKLALIQAKHVQNILNKLKIDSKIVGIESEGDKILNKPVYDLGITGIFTKNLDLALLNNKIDIAVHSLKDVPTSFPEGIIQSAVLDRNKSKDLIICKEYIKNLSEMSSILTGSVRRKYQWLFKFPNQKVLPIRGNINTRIKKFEKSNHDGLIVAEAAVDRLSISSFKTFKLNWMIPAPGQGAIGIFNRVCDVEITKILNSINHKKTQICTDIERDFLKSLDGGCSSPIAAEAEICNDILTFKGGIFNYEQNKKKIISKKITHGRYNQIGFLLADEMKKLIT
tara:strand:- start:13587 stop:14465 length:879 start_codon:yes stop_codon:yes gene_type:complete